MQGVVRALVVFALLALASCAISQDLGSSNKLFGAPRKSPPVRSKKTSARSGTRAKAKAKAPAKALASSPKTKRSKDTRIENAERPPVKTSDVTSAPATTAVAAVKPEAKPKLAGPPPTDPAAEALYEKLIDEGNAARSDRNYSGAEAAYRRAASIKPRDSRASFGLGNLYADQRRWDDAEASYRTALGLEPDNAVINIALSYVLSQPIIVSDLGERYEEAERLALRSTELDPQNALAFDQLGVAMESRGLISTGTENAYRTAIRLAPAFAPPYAHLGRLLRRRGLVKESAVLYQNAINNATDVATMIIVAEVMQSEQRFAESIALLKPAVDNDPLNPTGLLLLGQALTTTGKYSDAEKVLRKSLDVAPNAFMSNSLLSTLYLRQGKLEMAENALLQALRFVSPNEKRLLSLQFEKVGDAYSRSGKETKAQRAYGQAFDLDPKNEALTTKLAKGRHG